MAEVQALHTVSASETAGAGQFLVSDGPSTGPSTYAPLTVRIAYYNAKVASGSGTLQFTMQYSYDKGATWTAGASGASIATSTTAATGEQVITDAPNQATNCGQVWVQCLATLTGSTPSLSYRADVL